MKLLLRRSERSSVLGNPIYILEVRADLSQEERGWITKYKFGSVSLYSKRPQDFFDPKNASVAGVGLAILHHALNITVTVTDLVHGKRIECKNILEMLTAEEQIKEAARTFGNVLRAASQFDGEEVVAI